MASIYVRQNNVTYTLDSMKGLFNTKSASPCLCIEKKNASTDSTSYLHFVEGTSGSVQCGIYKCTYDPSVYPRIALRYNNKTYYAANKRVENYDVPPGTYTPSAFAALIGKFITKGGSRAITTGYAQIAITVNNKKIYIKKGSVIYYRNVNSSFSLSNVNVLYDIDIVGFDSFANNFDKILGSFIDYKTYVVARYTDSFGLFKTFDAYPIEVREGFMFA